MMKSDEKWENADIFSEIKTGENEVQYLPKVPGKATSRAHSAFPLRKHRFAQWMSLHSETAFTSNFQTNADKIQSNSQDSHLPSTALICFLRAHFGVWIPDCPSIAAPVHEQDCVSTGFLNEQCSTTKKQLCLLRQKCTLWAMIV